MNLEVLIGQEFGTVTVQEAGRLARTKVKIKCVCGVEKKVSIGSLYHKSVTSCGRCTAKTHGMSHTKINTVWLNIMARCYNPKNPAYHNYGGRGIQVCNHWHSFDNFYKDLGDVPEGMQLDRIDNDSDYEPMNVRWVTRKENCRNTRNNLMIEINGVARPLIEWVESDICVVAYNTARRRLSRGWEPYRALTTPSK